MAFPERPEDKVDNLVSELKDSEENIGNYIIYLDLVKPLVFLRIKKLRLYVFSSFRIQEKK